MANGEQNKPDFSNVTARVEQFADEAAAQSDGHFSPDAARGNTTSVPGSSNAEHYYVVQKNDTLSKIALHTLGDATAWPRLFEANRTVVTDPNHIKPGQRLKIPPSS